MSKFLHTLISIYVAVLVLCTPTGHTKTLAESVLDVEQQQARQLKIIALAPHIVELLFDIGAGEQIVGTTDFADYPEQALSIPRVGNAVKLKLETIIAMEPDLVIAWQSGNPAQDLAKLKSLGIQILYSQPDTFDELAEEVSRFAVITGHSERGEMLSQALRVKLDTLKRQYRNKQAINVFYEVWNKPLTTVARHAWPQRHLDICHVNNPFSNLSLDYPQISIESLAEQNIEVIVQPTSPKDPNPMYFDWTPFDHFTAVKNSNFIQPNADALHRMTVRSLDEVARLCAQLDAYR